VGIAAAGFRHLGENFFVINVRQIRPGQFYRFHHQQQHGGFTFASSFIPSLEGSRGGQPSYAAVEIQGENNKGLRLSTNQDNRVKSQECVRSTYSINFKRHHVDLASWVEGIFFVL
jgi:hypothetical protein